MSELLGYDLVERLLLPLMNGGDVGLVPPIGSVRALECASSALAPDQLETVRRFKLGAARRIYPVDELGGLSESEWLLLSALNDTLTLAHPSLTRAKHKARLSALSCQVIERAAPPRTPLEALSRHALFSRLLHLIRRDQNVSWWTGSQRFVGRRPPARLLAWPELRRVRVETEAVPMAGLSSEPFRRVLAAWLAVNPLTHLLGAPLFSGFTWSGSALSLLADPSGRRLVLRAILASEDPPRVLRALGKAPSVGGEAGRVVSALIAELSARLAQL